MRVIDRDEVARRLDHAQGIALVRAAMIALAQGHSAQLLRGILDLGGGDLFGVMPGSLDGAGFGAKVVSVFPSAAATGRSHQGVIVLFDRASGAPVCVVDAGEVTAIRTACASAVATDALARSDATTLAILGTGEQAWHHALALRHVRPLSRIAVWGRDAGKARAFAERVSAELGIPAHACAGAREATGDADIVCTVTAASEPILQFDDVAAGCHVNAVGSSRAGPVEIDPLFVSRARFIPDHREGVLAQGAEFLRAKALGLADENTVGPDIGHVLAGYAPGRTDAREITVYKSLGSIVQDLACAAWLHGAATEA
ncbi:MAG TPA: ornithine cyclodeaminase family protein [Lysobacter sp.]|nr:ornithine cyclodeaminase family protein [Lysobacter sp.]